MMQAALLVGVNEMENRKQLLRVEQVKGSFTPKPLTKPCVSLSIHRALIIQSMWPENDQTIL
jgi:hypothetical protein